MYMAFKGWIFLNQETESDTYPQILGACKGPLW